MLRNDNHVPYRRKLNLLVKADPPFYQIFRAYELTTLVITGIDAHHRICELPNSGRQGPPAELEIFDQIQGTPGLVHELNASFIGHPRP
ncbi:hypothetical protein DL768_007734 [Monosporascus sp. mg162]|nr:hypothetical protein DL768_007734 [Monosporascus sp. mg162]